MPASAARPSAPDQPRERKRATATHLRGIAVELAAFLAVFAGLLAVLLHFNSFDRLYAWTRSHEGWQLDEVILAALSAGLTCLIFVVRRWWVEHQDKQRISRLSVELEQALKAAEAADKAKSTFLAGLSHELRTPLNAIGGYAQLIESRKFGPIESRYVTYAQDIRESGEHLLNLINDLLDISRASAGGIRLTREDVDLHALTERSFTLLKLRAKTAGVALTNLVPESFPRVNADPQRLEQIVINLVSNAVKFSPRGAEVEVAASREADTAVIAVRDKGIGMTREEAMRALEPFVQIDSKLRKSHEGAGLGLALVKQFVELHGGTLDFETAPGQGTAVTVTLPHAVVPHTRHEGAA